MPPVHIEGDWSSDGVLVGAVLGRWRWTTGEGSASERAMIGALKASRAVKKFGFVVYEVLEFCEMNDFHFTVHPTSPALAWLAAKDLLCCQHVGARYASHQSLDQMVTGWLGACDAKLVANVVSLGVRLACSVVGGVWHCFRAVRVSGKSYGSWPLSRPSREALQRLRAEACATTVAHARTRKLRSGQPNAMPAHRVIQWLDASQHIKQLSHVNQAAKTFLSLVHDDGVEAADRLLTRLGKSNDRTLRRARVKADCLATIGVRRLWKSLGPTEVCLNIFADGSPQWRGLELLASTVDLHTGPGCVERRLQPLVSLERCQLSSHRKAVAI